MPTKIKRDTRYLNSERYNILKNHGYLNDADFFKLCRVLQNVNIPNDNDDCVKKRTVKIERIDDEAVPTSEALNKAYHLLFVECVDDATINKIIKKYDTFTASVVSALAASTTQSRRNAVERAKNVVKQKRTMKSEITKSRKRASVRKCVPRLSVSTRYEIFDDANKEIMELYSVDERDKLLMTIKNNIEASNVVFNDLIEQVEALHPNKFNKSKQVQLAVAENSKILTIKSIEYKAILAHYILNEMDKKEVGK